MRQSVAEVVRNELTRREWSMAELDRQCGFSIGESARWLTGGRSIGVQKVELILKALDLVVRRQR